MVPYEIIIRAVNYVSQVHGALGMVLLHCCSVQGRAQKRSNDHCLHFCLGGSCPPALVLMPDTSVPPCKPVVPYKVLPWCWRPEGVSLSKSVCKVLQEEVPENPTVSSTIPTPAGFYSQKLLVVIFLTLEPWAGCGAGIHHS